MNEQFADRVHAAAARLLAGDGRDRYGAVADAIALVQATDAALAALAPAPVPGREITPDDAERVLARFGAEVVRRWWWRFSGKGFDAAGGTDLDDTAAMVGLMASPYTPAPGIREAVARLTGGAA